MRPIMPQPGRAGWARQYPREHVDPSTGQHYPLTEARWRADNGHYLNLAPAPGLGRADIDASRHSVWRYARGAARGRRARGQPGRGWDSARRGRLERRAGPLQALEFMMPTGSFKDRGMTVMVSYLRSRSIDRLLEDSSGNAGASPVRLPRLPPACNAACSCPRPRRIRRSPRSLPAARTS